MKMKVATEGENIQGVFALLFFFFANWPKVSSLQSYQLMLMRLSEICQPTPLELHVLCY